MAHQTVTSADGTAIAYETFGSGPALIVVCGATCDRALMRPTARALGEHFTTVDYDRRGRGDSGDTLPYDVDREIEDIAALIDAVGGFAHLYGHSSGAALVLRAVAAGLAVDRFVLHDPPYSPDDESSREAARDHGRRIRGLLAENRRAEAIETFCRLTGMPDEVIDGMRQTPRWSELVALAPTLAYDSAVMGDIESGGAVPADVAARAARPGLVLVGGASPPFMREVSLRLADLLPEGSHHVVEGHGHVVPPEVLAPVVAQYLHG
jgi:Alpha/beta hydrolase family